MNPAFTPTKKMTSPTNTYTIPFNTLLNGRLFNRKEKKLYPKKTSTIGSKAIKISFEIVGSSWIKGSSIVPDGFKSTGNSPVNSFCPVMIFKNITAMIAPEEEIATKPKLSFSEAFPFFFKEDIPEDNANINGTVSAPVVAPEASNEMAKNSLEVKR